MIAAIANHAWLAMNFGAGRRFYRELLAPEDTQWRLLNRMLVRHSESAFGRAHGFATIRSAAEFQKRVSLSNYEATEPWIARIMKGEANVLTVGAVSRLVPTSGSSGARKLIPYTSDLQQQFNAAIHPWVCDLWSDHPSAFSGPAFWSISPAMRFSTPDHTCVPVGFDDDTAYLGSLGRRLMDLAMAVPSSVRHLGSFEAFASLTLVHLLRCKNLRLISIWHPTYLTLLLQRLEKGWPEILEMVRSGRVLTTDEGTPAHIIKLRLVPDPKRASELAAIGPCDWHRFWPKLRVISCWADGNAAAAAARLREVFPGVVLQPKGLLATEAFVTIPFFGLHPLAVGSHYFEFLDEAGNSIPLHALQTGQFCEVVVTTGGGFWRYRLGDRVQVDGWIGRTPSLRFIGREGRLCDLRGEKLSDAFVAATLRAVVPGAIFAMLAPADDQANPGYILFVDARVVRENLCEELDKCLCANPHYQWCRTMGQLRAVRVFPVGPDAENIYLERRRDEGNGLGSIKIPSLECGHGWETFFSSMVRPA